jgi:hypothetical protein
VAVAGLLALTALTAPTRAQERDPREREAKKACLGGRTARGIELLAEMYAETNDPTYIYNQGRCFQQSGNAREALSRFREYLRKAPTMSADDRALVQGYISELEEQIKTTPPPPDLSAHPEGDSQTLVSSPAQADQTPPIYKRWWFWTGLGVVVAGAVVTTVLVTRPSDPTPYMGNLNPGTFSVPSR